MTWYWRFLILSLLLSFAILDGAAAQSSSEQMKQAPTLHTNTRLVVVDVVATDNKGQAVPNLKADDFSLFENGKSQKISAFNFEHTKSTSIATQMQLPPTVVTNAPKFQSNGRDVILFDVINGEFAEQAYARDQLLKFLNGTELTRPVAIFALESQLKLLHDFTMDSKSLSQAVSKYRLPATQGMSAETTESRASAFTTEGDYHTNEVNIQATLNQLNALAKIMAGYPGRKNLIWLSESFPLVLFPETLNLSMNNQNTSMGNALGGFNGSSIDGGGAQRLPISADLVGSPNKSYASLVKKVSDVLMAAQVAVYPVDSATVTKNDHLASQHTMENMAERTGGRALKNSNDLVTELRTGVEDGVTYYTLSYYPDNKNWDGQFRVIQIKTSRADLTLRYREGYYALDPDKLNKEAVDASAENFSRSLQLDSPEATAVLFQAQVLPPSDKNKKVIVTFHINPQTITFEHKESDEEYAKVACSVWAYGKNKGKPEMFNGTVTANLKAKDYQAMMQQQFLPCNQELDLKPGNYTLRLGVLDRTSNKFGTATYTLAVQ